MAKFDAVDRLMKLATEKAAPGKRREAKAPILQAATDIPLAVPDVSEPAAVSGERGRQLLSAIRPLLPAVGGALRMVDHGAVQAVARLLPLLGSATMARKPQLDAVSGSSNAGLLDPNAAMEEELAGLRNQIQTQEEQLRHLRESLERVAAEQGSLVLQALGLNRRSRLLAGGVFVLFLLVIAESVVLAVILRR